MVRGEGGDETLAYVHEAPEKYQQALRAQEQM